MALTWYRHFQRNGGLNQILRRQAIFVFQRPLKLSENIIFLMNQSILYLEIYIFHSNVKGVKFHILIGFQKKMIGV
jgi:hypothetical protein